MYISIVIVKSFSEPIIHQQREHIYTVLLYACDADDYE